MVEASTPIDPLSAPSAAQSTTLSQRGGGGDGSGDGGGVTARRWWRRQLGPWMWQLNGGAVAMAAWLRWRQLGSVGSAALAVAVAGGGALGSFSNLEMQHNGKEC